MDEYEQSVDRALEAQEVLQHNLDNGLIYDHLPFDNPDLSWVAFFMAVHHILTHTVYKIFREYEDEMGLYAVSREIAEHSHKETDGEHFHFIIAHKQDNEVLNKAKTNSLMRHFVNKYNLAGNSQGTRVRQYGLIQKRIRSVVNIIRYCIKGVNWEEPNYNLIITEDQYSEEYQSSILDTIKALPVWEDNEEDDSKRFFLQTLEEIKRQPQELLNNDYSLIKFILNIYDLAKKHPPVKATIQKYLRVIDYKRLHINDFIDKYYLN